MNDKLDHINTGKQEDLLRELRQEKAALAGENYKTPQAQTKVASANRKEFPIKN